MPCSGQMAVPGLCQCLKCSLVKGHQTQIPSTPPIWDLLPAAIDDRVSSHNANWKTPFELFCCWPESLGNSLQIQAGACWNQEGGEGSQSL